MSTEQIIDNYICSHCIIPSMLPGGDTAEIFKITEKQYGFYLLDVAGHGTVVINTVTQIKDIIIQLANSKQNIADITNPKVLVNKLNLLLHTQKLCKYSTLLYGILDLNNNCFNYVIAGHYPNPILVDQQQHAKYALGKGMPLGILANAQFEEFSIKLAVNDTIILFSDGVIKSLMLNLTIEDRVNHLLALASNTQADLNILMQQLHLNFTANNIKDDITIITVKRTN